MSAPRTRKRLMELFRRTAGLDASAPSPALSDAELWDCETRAMAAVREAEKLGERVAALGARQRPQLDEIAERLRDLHGRMDAGATGARRLEQVLDRMDVAALSAALEASRTEPGNRPLALLAEDVRTQVASGKEGLLDVLAQLRQAEEVTQLAQRSLEAGQRSGAELSADAERLKVATQDGARSLTELENRLRRATGLDPETARLMNVASEHARGLAASLSALEGPRANEALKALGPLLAPLSRILATFDPPADGDDT